MDFSNFEFRCHYMGDLMTPAKGKSNAEKYEEYNNSADRHMKAYEDAKNKTTASAKKSLEMAKKMDQKANDIKPFIDELHLSEKCKNKLIEIYTEATTGRKKQIKNFYVEKGLHTEELAITQYAMLKNEMFYKNKVREHNGFITGEMDFEEDPFTSVDTKSSWEVFTFDQTVVKSMNPNYYWQGQCYMWLFNKKRHRLLYNLINTPDFIFNKLKNNLKYEVPEEEYEAALADLTLLHRYDDLPIERKVRPYLIERDDDKIQQMIEMIPKFREFLNNIDKGKIILENEQDD